MTDINIENIVVSIQVAKSLDLDKLSQVIPDSKYNPEEVAALILHFKIPKTAVMFFSDGNVVLTGPKDMNEVDEIVKTICNRLTAAGVKLYKNPKVEIKNIIASSDLKKPLDLPTIARSLKDADYKPERFPGLIYKMNDPNTIMLLFDSGKIVCNGSKSEEISIAIDKMTNELSSLEVEEKGGK